MSALAEQGIDCLDLIPALKRKWLSFTEDIENSFIITLLGSNLRQERRRPLGSSFIKKLNTDAVNTQSPI